MTKFFNLYTLFIFGTTLFGQDTNKKITVRYISDSIMVDGVFDEPIWNTTEVTTGFWQHFPSDSILAEQQSEIKMLFDDNHLYVGIKAYAVGDDYIIESLKRDFSPFNNDNINLLFDTYSDGNIAYYFGIDPMGVRREGLISKGGTFQRNSNSTWDTKWKGESKTRDGYYSAEISIPLSSLKFKEGETKWRFNSFRYDTQSNERSTWAQIPSNQLLTNLAFMGEMVFERPLGKPKSPFSLIPYINAFSSKDYVENNSVFSLKLGGDAKIAIGSSLNLDVTVNPDFSQVEVDDQVVNLTRFEISLPEKRQFFIDNSDLFSGFGGGRDANPFFSRRIGLARDKDGKIVENKIIAGVRLSGKINKDWRLGFLNIQTEEDLDNEIPGNNNMALALQRKMFTRSTMGLIFINRESFKQYDFLPEQDQFNRVLGLDYNLASVDDKWEGRAYVHKSFEKENNGKNFSSGIALGYHIRNLNTFIDMAYVGDNFRSDLGFIRRTDIFKGTYMVEGVFWPKKGSVFNHYLRILNSHTWQPDFDFKNTDNSISASWEVKFNDQANFEFNITNQYTYLTGEFDPTNTLDMAVQSLPAHTDYSYTNISTQYRSSTLKPFSFVAGASFGQFFNGHKSSLETSLGARIQPHFLAYVKMDYHRIELPEPYANTSIWLLGPKLDFVFSKKMSWSTLIQYTYNKNNNVNNNFGINSRLQWRFAPLSDLFVVYNDNYFVSNYSPRIRSINLKLSYWLNL